MNSNKLKARIVELGLTQGIVAKKINIATSTLCLKLNNARPFTLDEAKKLAEILEVKNEEFGVYFFLHEVA